MLLLANQLTVKAHYAAFIFITLAFYQLTLKQGIDYAYHTYLSRCLH